MGKFPPLLTLWTRDGTETDIGAPPAPFDEGIPQAINDRGQVVGYGHDDVTTGYDHAFVYNGSKIIDIGTLGGTNSRAVAINNAGQVVGFSLTATGAGVAMLYQNGSLYDLNNLIPANSGWKLIEAVSISDLGQIVGDGTYNGQPAVFCLTPQVYVSKSAMINSHTLRIQVGAFIDPQAVTKYLLVSLVLNGQPLGSSWQIPASTSGSISHTFDLDLAQAGVHRFDDNQSYAVTVDRYEDGKDTASTSVTYEIPLPVVHVHGILTDASPDRIPHGLFDYLKQIHPSYQLNSGFPDLGPDSGYPTLVSFDYKSMQDKVETAGLNLAFWLTSQVLPHTYATRVNVVAHSKGGIVSRAAIAYENAGQIVNNIILVGSPTEGSPYAAIAYSYFGAIKAVIQYTRLRYGSLLPNTWDQLLNALVSSTPDSVLELCPTYPWLAGTRTDALAGRFQSPPRPSNDTLNRLNAIPLDSRVSYYTITSGTWLEGGATLNSVWGKYTIPLQLQNALTDDVDYGAGDGLVPLRSQLASDLSWQEGQGPGTIHHIETLFDLFHTGYFDNFNVQRDVEEVFWPSP